MKRPIKLIAIFVCLVMLVSAVAACSGGTDSNTSSTGTTTVSPSGSGAAATSPAQGGSEAPAGTEGGESSAPTDGAIVSARDSATIAITQDRGTLDPLYTVGWDNQQVLRCVYEPLWEFDENYQEIKYVLATSYDDSDPLKWIIKLREDVYFANGNKFTADDVVFSLYMANNRKGEPPYFLYMDNEATRAVDDYTVEVVFTRYRADYAAIFPPIFMFDEESYNEDTVAFETNGTGRYEITEYVIQSHTTLKARDDYWGGGMPPIENITFRVLMEEAQRVNALQTGEIDSGLVPYQEIEYVETMEHLETRQYHAVNQRTIILNCTTPDSIFYDNMDARLAVFHAIDPQSVLNIVFNGYGAISRAPYTMWASDANEADFDKGIYDGSGYNPELARQLAESSGLTEVELVCINNGSSDMATIAQLLQQALQEIGVTMINQTSDAGSWLTLRFDENAFDIAVDFTGNILASVDIATWWQYAGNYNQADAPGDPLNTERLRELTDEVLAITDLEVRRQYVSDMTDELNELNLFYNLVDREAIEAYNKDLVLPHLQLQWIDWENAYWIA